MTTNRLPCPAAELPRSDRLAAILQTFEGWITDDAFTALMEAFGGDPTILRGDTPAKLRRLQTFTPVWDYRKRQTAATTREGEAARWLLQNDDAAQRHHHLIIQASQRLGLIGTDTPLRDEADFLLPLGGARMANLRRCELARQTRDSLRRQPPVAALSGMRPLSDTERRGYIDTYAPAAATEFDAITRGMALAFGVPEDYRDTHYPGPPPHGSGVIRSFQQGGGLFALAAPSADPARRADSADCFRFFFRQFPLPEHAALVNCTSQLYCTYQQVRSLAFAVEEGVFMDTIGFPYTLNEAHPAPDAPQYNQAVNYLQEIKATVDAMNDFLRQFHL